MALPIPSPRGAAAAAAASGAVQALLAQLGPTQQNRLLRLHTPLGPEVLLAERVHAVEAVGPGSPGQTATGEAPVAGYRIELLALSSNAHLVLKDLIGQPVRLDLLTAASRTDLRPFHGHVTAFTLLGSDGGLARYRLCIEPWLAFLTHTRDAWSFRSLTVMQIIDEIFSGYRGQGRLLPAWRWALLNKSVYPERSLCTQYQESDLAFVHRLLADEGLFYWFEHSADATDAFGQHTLVISDHNHSFAPSAQPRVRYTQSGATFEQDSLTSWRAHHGVKPDQLELSSWDHRALRHVAATERGRADAPSGPRLVLRDDPGAYHFESGEQAQRIARRRLEALQAPGHQYLGRGTLRSAAPGTRITLSGHDSLDRDYLLLRVRHRARNNLNADARATLRGLLGEVSAGSLRAAVAGDDAEGGSEWAERAERAERIASQQAHRLANATDEPLYQCELLAQQAEHAVRAPQQDPSGRPLHPRPNARGLQTATVVGIGTPVYTDRDARIKVQMHWQRGGRSSHRLNPRGGDNAPGNDSAGTWVRVSHAWAGANWGSRDTPRVGQEVFIGFVEGDIDRPVAVGVAYSGTGRPNAPGNLAAVGPSGLTGNAPAWFPGNQRSGEHEGHQHPHVLSGYKSQSLETSQIGNGHFNQLVFDDTPAQARTTLGSTQAATWLHLGHLLHQNDNQRLAHRGHGLELSTEAQGAVRAGSGLLLSAWPQPGGSTALHHAHQAREAASQLEQAGELQQTLADSAQQHNASLADEAAAPEHPARLALQATVESLNTTDTQGYGPATSATGEALPIDGGHGNTPAWSRPDLVLTAPGGVTTLTPAHSVLSAGNTTSLVAGQDLHIGSQRNTAVAVETGLSLFTYGQAQNPTKPNAETGIQLHAASGSVSVQAAANTMAVTADKLVGLTSTTDAVRASAPKGLLLTAGGSYLRLSGNNIEIGTQGQAVFKGALRELAQAKSAGDSLVLKKPAVLKGCAMQMGDAKASGSAIVVR